jgi:enoyl-[acyl-carrier protein] reductase I
MLDNQTFLITGIADENSLAMKTAEKILKNNGKVVCTGLGVTSFHKNLSEKAESFSIKIMKISKMPVKSIGK